MVSHFDELSSKIAAYGGIPPSPVVATGKEER
jgi:hypothetical protein